MARPLVSKRSRKSSSIPTVGDGVKLDLRARALRLAESLEEINSLAATDQSCKVIAKRVLTLQASGLPQVAAIQQAVGAA